MKIMPSSAWMGCFLFGLIFMHVLSCLPIPSNPVLHAIHAFPLKGGNKDLHQDVYSSAGMPEKCAGRYALEEDVAGQPGLAGISRNTSRELAHGYLGGNLSGISVGYIRSLILDPLHNSSVDHLPAFRGRVASPVQIKEERILLERLSDSRYFNGESWQNEPLWLISRGTGDWVYSLIRDTAVLDYGVRYRLSARGVDVTGCMESGFPVVDFTFLFSVDTKKSFCNYPNPFYPDSADPSRSSTVIEYYLKSASSTAGIYIYAMNGEMVRSWTGEGYGTAGLHRIVWNGRNRDNTVIASGIYMLLLEAGGFRILEKIAVIR